MFSKLIPVLKRVICLTTILIILSSSLISSAIAIEENLSISGTAFLDLDSNGIKASNEPGLARLTIYWDENKNRELDAGEKKAITDDSGKYNFRGLSNGTYIIWQSDSDKFQLSSPKEGYYSVNLTGNNLELDFGNSLPSTSDYNNLILLGIGILALIFIGSGLYALRKSWSELSSSDKEDRRTRTLILLASAFILLVLGIYLAILLIQLSRNLTASETLPGSFALVTPVILTLLVFGAVLVMLYAQTKLQQKDEVGGMRKTMAGLLVIGLVAVVLFSLTGTINPANQNIVTQFIQLVGIVVAFYFGTKATEDAYKGAGRETADTGKDLEKDIKIKSVALDESKKQIVIEGTNEKRRNFNVTNAIIEESRPEDTKKESLFKTKEFAFTPIGEALSEFQVFISLSKDELEKIKKAGKKCTVSLETDVGAIIKCGPIGGVAGDGNAEDEGAGKDLDIESVTYYESEGQIVINGTKEKGQKFTVSEVGIKFGDKPLVDKKTPKSQKLDQSSTEFTVTIVAEEKEEKERLKNAIGKKCTITLKVDGTPISRDCTITSEEPEDPT
jgi:hypothetical protein